MLTIKIQTAKQTMHWPAAEYPGITETSQRHRLQSKKFIMKHKMFLEVLKQKLKIQLFQTQKQV